MDLSKMDEHTFLKHYTHFYKILQQIANHPLAERLTIENSGISRASIQCFYRYSKKKFDASAISFIDFHLAIVVEFFNREIEKIRSIREQQSGQKERRCFSDLETAIAFNGPLFRVIIRQFLKNPFSVIALTEPENESEEEAAFQKLAMLWLKELKKDRAMVSSSEQA